MDKTAQRIAIHKARGLKFDPDFLDDRCPECGFALEVPDYLNDLNAMHEAESLLTLDQMNRYTKELFKVMYVMPHDVGTAFLFIATATQRAEAFLKTLGLWKDDASNLNTVASDTVTN